MNTEKIDRLTALRRELHANPERSGQELRTAERIRAYIARLEPDELLIHVGGTGVMALFDSGTPGPVRLFRCELDALPIAEENTFPHRSLVEGASHKCGHDGHMAILCGLAECLAEERPASGKVWLLFQPAEENGEGAKAVLADERMRAIKPDRVFALHNLPGVASGTVMVRDGAFTASVNSIIITFLGKTAHAAEPEHGIDPAPAMSAFFQQSLALNKNVPADTGMRVVSSVYAELGSKDHGISAGRAEVHLTLRCWTDEELLQLQQEVEAIAQMLAERYKLGLKIEHTQRFHANHNHSAMVAMVRNAAEGAGLRVEEAVHPYKWGEDFGLFTAAFPGCMVGLGAGEDMPALHNPDYDFPDELIAHGAALFNQLARVD
ncbi:MAG TPA: amidohydrolase [Flavobacteriales bacterium]|nr:amidohydrolase [Flavobacteriales bacterium]